MTCHSYNVVNRAPSPYTHCDHCGSLLDICQTKLVACRDGWFCGVACHQNYLESQQPVALFKAMLVYASRLLSRAAEAM